MLSIGAYRDKVASFAPAPTAVSVPLDQAAGLVMVTAADALVDIPHWDNSAMDGYAVAAAGTEEVPRELEIVDEVAAGQRGPLRLAPHHAAPIMTGAPVPEGTYGIVPVEDAQVDGELLRVGPVSPGRHIRRRGEDARAGDLVVRAGTVLDAVDVAALAAAGYGQVEVFRRPRVAVIATGAELVEAGAALGPAQIHDSNSLLLAHVAREGGADVISVRRCSDDAASFVTALEESLSADVVVTSGGVSMGTRDVVKEVLEGSGVEFVTVAMQPGKPQGCGTVDSTPVVCLPGNPVSAWVSFHVFVAPVLRASAGRTRDLPTSLGVVAEGWHPRPGRTQVMPVTWATRHEGLLEGLRPAHRGGSASHHVSSIARARGLAIVPEDIGEVRVGQTLPVMEVRP